MILFERDKERLASEMKRSDIDPMPEYYDRYINEVADLEVAFG